MVGFHALAEAALAEQTIPFFRPVETPPHELVWVRDLWDRDEWGNFIPGAGIRQVR